MATTPALAPPLTHIRLDEWGIPFVDGTTFRVEWLVNEHLHWGWSPEEMTRQHPGSFAVAQAHAALAYYFENRAAMDRMMEEHSREMELLRVELGEVVTRAELEKRLQRK